MHVFLNNRQYRVLAISAFASRIGSVLFNLVFLIYAQTLPFATQALSLVTVANMIPSFLMIPNGYLADHTKSGKRMPMLIGMRLIQTGLYVILALIIGNATSRIVFWTLLGINVLSDLVADYTDGLILHYQQYFLSQAEYQEAMGFSTGIGSIISIVFQAVGASLIVLVNHNYALFGLINAASFGVAAFVLMRDRHSFEAADVHDNQRGMQDIDPAAQSGTTKQGIFGAVKSIFADRQIMTIIVLAMLVNTLGTSLDGLINVLIASTQQLWFGNFGTTVALISMVTSGAMIIASLFMRDGLQHLSLAALTTITMVGLTLFALNMCWWQNRYLLLPLIVLASYPIGKINPRISSELMSRIAPDNLAAAASVLQTCIMIGAPIGVGSFLGIANLVTPLVAWEVYGGAALVVTGIAGSVVLREHRGTVRN